MSFCQEICLFCVAFCNMVVTNIYFFSISKPNNPKIVRKYRAACCAWNFLQIYFVMLSDYANRIIIILYLGVPRAQVFTI